MRPSSAQESAAIRCNYPETYKYLQAKRNRHPIEDCIEDYTVWTVLGEPVPATGANAIPKPGHPAPETGPPPAKKEDRKDTRRVAISELPEHARLAFKGVKALNELQSAVVGTALHSNENMLVCAPTGAGKTNVAVLAMMQQVGTCVENGVFNR